MIEEVLVSVLCLCLYITPSLQQVHHQQQQQQQQQYPPGVPPPSHQGAPQQQVYPDGHAPQPGHHHQGGHQGGMGLNAHDQEHVKEHLKEVMDKPKDQMTEEELEFHYFKLHDYDDNNKLDGVEIVKAITHFHADEDKDGEKETYNRHKIFTDKEIGNLIDMVMAEDDFDNDGYITYPEFAAAQRRSKNQASKS